MFIACGLTSVRAVIGDSQTIERGHKRVDESAQTNALGSLNQNRCFCKIHHSLQWCRTRESINHKHC